MRWIAVVTVAGCAKEPDDVVLPDVTQATFVDGVDNPYFPLPVGATWHYEAETEDGTETIDVLVSTGERVIQGVTAVVVQDTERLDGVLVEDTFDWYAQDTEGNVWYLGEDTCEYENDVCVDQAGSWEWGVGNALPGILMPGNPTVDGQAYYQEYDVGVAEDAGEVIETGFSVTVPAGTFDDCIRTRDFSTLDPTLHETKDYCPGVGNVFVDEQDQVVELFATTGL
jgi:hypothetical protein